MIITAPQHTETERWEEMNPSRSFSRCGGLARVERVCLGITVTNNLDNNYKPTRESAREKQV
jgi:hypothetical protein